MAMMLRAGPGVYSDRLLKIPRARDVVRARNATGSSGRPSNRKKATGRFLPLSAMDNSSCIRSVTGRPLPSVATTVNSTRVWVVRNVGALAGCGALCARTTIPTPPANSAASHHRFIRASSMAHTLPVKLPLEKPFALMRR